MPKHYIWLIYTAATHLISAWTLTIPILSMLLSLHLTICKIIGHEHTRCCQAATCPSAAMVLYSSFEQANLDIRYLNIQGGAPLGICTTTAGEYRHVLSLRGQHQASRSSADGPEQDCRQTLPFNSCPSVLFRASLIERRHNLHSVTADRHVQRLPMQLRAGSPAQPGL